MIKEDLKKTQWLKEEKEDLQKTWKWPKEDLKKAWKFEEDLKKA